MTNLVAITVKATDSSDYAAIKASAAKAGTEAADAFNRAFKLRADAHASGSESGGGGGSEGLIGKDASILSRMKSYANTPGGIGLIGTGSDTSIQSMLKNQIRSMGENGGGPGLLSGGQSTTDMVRQVLENNVGGNMSSTDLVKQVLANSVTGNVTTEDIIKQVLEGSGPGNVTTSDYIKQVLEGNTPGNISTKDVIHPTVDDTDIDALGKKDGETYGSGFASSVKSALSKMFSGGGKGGGGGSSFVGNLLTGGGGGESDSAISGALDSGGVAGGALPGVAGVSGMAATITGLAGALVAVLPAITAVAGGLGVIGGGFAVLMETSTKFKAAMTSDLTDLEGVAAKAAAPMIKPLEDAATQLVGYFKNIGPDLGKLFSAAVPLIQPLVKGFESLMTGAGPGFFAMIKAAGPVFSSMASAFGTLGKSLGTMFSDFASDGSGSGLILKSFLDLISSLLPFLGTLGKIMVSALAPAFALFSGTLSELLPALNPLIKIIGEFAGAVLTDLASILGSVGSLLVKLAPSFTALAKAASGVFTAMENDGVFASLGNALEDLGTPLANLINALVKALLPALPGIISAFSKFANIFTAAVVAAISAVAVALTDIIKAIPPNVLDIIVDGLVAIAAGIKLWSIAQAALNIVMDANPFVIVGLAIAALAVVVIKYHTQILTFIENTWNTVFGFIKQIWGDIESFAEQWWPLLLGPAGVIMKYHADIENGIKGAWNAILSFLKGIWNDISGAASSAWHGLASTASSDWNGTVSTAKSIFNGLVSWFSGLPGRIVSALGSLAGDLASLARTAFDNMLGGFESVGSTIVSWVKGFVGGIISDIKSILGIASPSTVFYDIGANLMHGMANGIEATAHRVASAAMSVAKKTAAAVAASAEKVATGGALSSGSQNANESALEAVAAAHGWGYGTAQWNDLFNVEMREAGFNLTATNPSSGAYGMAQFIDGPSEYAQYGGNASTASGQATAMVNYIIQRYGTPAAAWEHELNYGWYDHGGWLKPGYTLAYNGTGSMERVGGGGSTVVQLEISGGTTPMEQALATWVKNYVRTKGGGDVQKAFGRT